MDLGPCDTNIQLCKSNVLTFDPIALMVAKKADKVAVLCTSQKYYFYTSTTNLSSYTQGVNLPVDLSSQSRHIIQRIADDGSKVVVLQQPGTFYTNTLNATSIWTTVTSSSLNTLLTGSAAGVTNFAINSTATSVIVFYTNGSGQGQIAISTDFSSYTNYAVNVNATVYCLNDLFYYADLTSGGFYNFRASSTGTIACFPVGVNILTTVGYKNVETLSASDAIVTSDLRSVPFTMTKQSIVTTAANAPYLIPANALRLGVPPKNLYLSPDHAIQVAPGVWELPKEAAKDHKNIVQYGIGERIDYYHIELPNYLTDNIVAEGQIVESLNTKYNIMYSYNAAAKGYARFVKGEKTLNKA